MKKEIITYNEYDELIRELLELIKSSNIKYNVVHGIPRGGLPAAVYLSHALEIPLIINLNNFNQRFPEKRLLIVDDIVDGGETLKRTTELANVQNIIFSTAVLHYKPISSFVPDYYVKQTDNWIVYPWETVDELPDERHIEMYPDVFDE